MIRPGFMQMDESLWTPDEQAEGERRRRNFLRAAGICVPTLLAIWIATHIAKQVHDQQRDAK